MCYVLHMPPNHRKIINFRVSETGDEWITEVAWTNRCTRSDVIREALAFAARNGDDFEKHLKERA